jgi:hypothetical protein
MKAGLLFLAISASLSLLFAQVETTPQPEVRVAKGTLTATQVRNLRATPVEVIAAPAAGSAIVVESIQPMLDWNANAYDSVGAGEDIQLVTGATALLDVCDTATCLDLAAVADAYGHAANKRTSGIIPKSATAVTIKNSGAGEWAAADLDANGDSPIHYKIRYRVIRLDPRLT